MLVDQIQQRRRKGIAVWASQVPTESGASTTGDSQLLVAVGGVAQAVTEEVEHHHRAYHGLG